MFSLAIVGVFLAYNGMHAASFIAERRGQYREAIAWMAGASRHPSFTIGSDHDFRMEMVVNHHRAATPAASQAVYVRQDAWPEAGPDWLIVHAESSAPPTPRTPSVRDETGTQFVFERAFPAAPLSGLHWFVYRNAGRQGAAPAPRPER